jgi:hypothetical protein
MQELALVHVENMVGEVGHVHHQNVYALLALAVDHGLHLVFEFSTRGSVSVALSVRTWLGTQGHAWAHGRWLGQLIGPWLDPPTLSP